MIIRENVTEKWLAAGSSPVDWCEENYTVSRNIAEFTNTFSNFVFIIAPLLCFSTKIWKSYTKLVSTGVNIFLVFLVIIGASSFYFHAQLSLLGQLLDEIYIIWSFVFGYASFTPNKYRPYYFHGAVAYLITGAAGVVLTLFWFVSPYFNAFWMMLLALPVIAMVIQEVSFQDNPMTRSLRKMCIIGFAVSVSIWLSDRMMCGMWLTLGIPGIHSIWHIVSCAESYAVVTIFAYWKASIDTPHVKPSIRYLPGQNWGIPYVHCKEKLHC